MASLLKLEIIGNVGRDAEMRYTPSGQAVTSFSVAHTEQFESNSESRKKTIWVRVSVWGKLAEVCNKYVKKGMLVRVEGKLNGDNDGNPRIYNKQDGTPASSFEMTAFSVMFLSKVEGNDQPQGEELPPADDMPF
jgi:single-strand DNA-binding protein